MNRLLAAVRHVARWPGVRRLTEIRFLLRFSFALRASLVQERGRFVVGELIRGGTGVYHLRDSGVAVVIEHRTSHVLTLDEIFSYREYEPPERVAQRWRERPPETIADVGANIGLFGAWALGRFPGVKIVAFEPEPGNAAIHERVIAANRAAERWTLVRAAAAVSDGSVRFVPGKLAVSHVADGAGAGSGVVEVPAVDVFPRIADADFLKIDVEGSEWPLLQDARFADLSAETVVLEYHSHGCPGASADESARAALRDAGYATVASHPNPAGDAGLVWALRDR